MNEQGTEAWLADRIGMVTASRLSEVMAKTKSGPAASRANYLAELVAQRLTGKIESGFTSKAMEHGTENEPYARASYEILTGSIVEEAGFIRHPTMEWTGASPDGFVGSHGLVEIKCPNTATHIATLLGDPIPSKYQWQMLWQMECIGRDWCDFVSFDPRMPEELKLFVVRFQRDDDRIEEAKKEVNLFIGEIESTVAKLTDIIQQRRLTF